MAKITRFFDDVNVTSSGLEIQNIIGSIKNLHSGTIDQIIITQKSGTATQVDVSIRYQSGYGGREKLIYLYTEGALPLFVDSHINAQFSLYKAKNDIDGDIHLYLEPDSSCVLNIRIDIDVYNISGV